MILYIQVFDFSVKGLRWAQRNMLHAPQQILLYIEAQILNPSNTFLNANEETLTSNNKKAKTEIAINIIKFKYERRNEDSPTVNSLQYMSASWENHLKAQNHYLCLFRDN